MPRLEGLDDGEIPIEPTKQAYTIEVEGADEEQCKNKKAVHRRQLPITAAYASTDYRSQGQTLPYVIIDIAKLPTGKLSLFNLYVALSLALVDTRFAYCATSMNKYFIVHMTNIRYRKTTDWKDLV